MDTIWHIVIDAQDRLLDETAGDAVHFAVTSCARPDGSLRAGLEPGKVRLVYGGRVYIK